MRVLTNEELTCLLSPPSSTVSRFIKRASSFLFDPSRNTFIFQGQACLHTVTSSSLYETSKGGYCAVLAAFSLRWCPDLSLIIDTAEKTVVLSNELRKILAQTTEKMSSATINTDRLLDHLSMVYPINISETHEDIVKRFKKLQLKEPIFGLDEPVVRVQCNQCKDWFPSISKHRHRVKRGEFKDHPKAVICAGERYFILPLKKGGTMYLQKTLQVSMNAQYIPNKSALSEDNPPAQATSLFSSDMIPRSRYLVVPAFVSYLGWHTYLSQVKGSPETFLEFHNLAALHSKHKRWSSSMGKEVEFFLALVPGVVLEYLTQAEVRIASSHSSVRKLAAAQSVPIVLSC